MPPVNEVDVGRVLDSARFAGLPLIVMAWAAATMVLDGFDIQVIGFAAPAIAAQFGITRAELAPALAASLVGMAVGGFVLGPLGDRYGRRVAMLTSTAVFGSGTLLTAGCSSLEQLVVLRFITGLGLGGALPSATALMAEFAPPRARGQAISAALVGVPIGGMLGAALAAEVVPAFGWQVIFLIGGVLPLLAIVPMFFWLPESPRYLTLNGARNNELATILNRVVGEARFSGDERFALAATRQESPHSTSGLRGVFGRTLLGDTLALWLVFVSNLFAVYCFYNWAPVVLTTLGIELATAVRGSLVFNSAGVVGSILVAWLIARRGSRWPQALLGVIGAAALYWVGDLVGAAASDGTPVPLGPLMGGLAVAGFCILAVQVTMYAVAAHVYPTESRAAGVGWAQGMGRLGAVLSAFVGAAIMDLAGAAGFFALIAGILVLTVLGVLVLRRHVVWVPAPSGDVRPASARMQARG